MSVLLAPETTVYRQLSMHDISFLPLNKAISLKPGTPKPHTQLTRSTHALAHTHWNALVYTKPY